MDSVMPGTEGQSLPPSQEVNHNSSKIPSDKMIFCSR
jgi:hypothetical protein